MATYVAERHDPGTDLHPGLRLASSRLIVADTAVDQGPWPCCGTEHRRLGTSIRLGVGLTATAVLLWGVVVVALVTARPEDGANIGAGLLFILAVPCTVTGVALLIANRPAGQRSAPEPPPPEMTSSSPAETSGSDMQNNSVASWALRFAIFGVALALAPIGTSEPIYFVRLGVALLVCLGATLLGWLGLHRARARGGAGRSRALAGTIVGGTGLGLNLPLIPELVLFLDGDL